MSEQAVTSRDAPEPRGPYPHIRIHGDSAWITGQIGRDPVTGDFVEGGFEPEFHQAITNLENISGRGWSDAGRRGPHQRPVCQRG